VEATPLEATLRAAAHYAIVRAREWGNTPVRPRAHITALISVLILALGSMTSLGGCRQSDKETHVPVRIAFSTELAAVPDMKVEVEVKGISAEKLSGLNPLSTYQREYVLSGALDTIDVVVWAYLGGDDAGPRQNVGRAAATWTPTTPGLIIDLTIEPWRDPGGAGGAGMGGSNASGGAAGTGGADARGGAAGAASSDAGTGGSPNGMGGSGGASTSADGGSDESHDGPDAACDIPPPPPPPAHTCTDYCNKLAASTMSLCRSIYPSAAECKATCDSLGWRENNDTSNFENTVQCRMDNLNGPTCSYASATGGGTCSSRCTVYCEAYSKNCGGVRPNVSCMSDCATNITWSNSSDGTEDTGRLMTTRKFGQCFLYWAAQAGRPAADVATDCQNADSRSTTTVCQ
jgi:hypothetical protein